MLFSLKPWRIPERRQLRVLRLVASFEMLKGLVVLLAAVGILSLAHRDVWDVSATLLRLLHIHHTHHYWEVFLKLAHRVTDEKLWMVAVGAVVYSSLRFVEGYGLWRARAWAEWVAFFSGAVYLPFEIYELSLGITLFRTAIFAANLAIVLYMLWLRLQAREAHSLAECEPSDPRGLSGRPDRGWSL